MTNERLAIAEASASLSFGERDRAEAVALRSR